MKRTAVIAGVAIIILLLGIVAFVPRPGLAFAQAHGFGAMGGPGIHGMKHAGMGAGVRTQWALRGPDAPWRRLPH